jgi:hypothetical protein
MPSFDIVSQVNTMEIENAVNQAKKELANRFDFKGGKWEIGLKKTGIKQTADNEFICGPVRGRSIDRAWEKFEAAFVQIIPARKTHAKCAGPGGLASELFGIRNAARQKRCALFA